MRERSSIQQHRANFDANLLLSRTTSPKKSQRNAHSFLHPFYLSPFTVLFILVVAIIFPSPAPFLLVQGLAAAAPFPAGKNNNHFQHPFQKQPPSSRALRVAFVTGNEMKAREVEAIILEHCYSGPSAFVVDSEDTDDALDVSNLENDDDDEDEDSEDCRLLALDLYVLDVDLPEIQEVDTLAIAKNKAMLGSQLVNGPCLVEDTSLCFHALGGMPGPYIKWFQQTLRSEGLYNILAAYPNKSATAICTLAFSPSAHADPVLFTGECVGRIVPPIPGRGFGWDSIFVPEHSNVPFSQMEMTEKNAVSHRGKAVRQFANWIGRNQDALLARQERKGSVLGHQGLTFSLRPKKNGVKEIKRREGKE